MDKEFYESTWKNGYSFAKLIIPALSDFFTLRNVIDVGCGAGGFLKFCEEDFMTIHGIDINKDVIDKCSVISYHEITELDLTKSIKSSMNRAFDLCVSLEVAEHIDEKYSDIFMDNLCFLSNLILFSAAKPGQPGEGHINCQLQAYWIKKFLRRDYTQLLGLSKLLRGNVDIPTYYRENSMIFFKVTGF